MLEKYFILAVYDIIGIFLNIYNFFFILELAAQFVFKARKNLENSCKINNFPAKAWNRIYLE